MDTLKSNKIQCGSICGVFIFSGCPDPTWQIDEVSVKELEKIWNGLHQFKGKMPTAEPLGYRGCFIRHMNDAEWLAYGGVVTMKTEKGEESRIDKERIFERLLLDSAPKGIIPKVIF